MTEIFKISGKDEWDAAEVAGIYHGSEDDKRDGIMHFSTASQLPDTLARHFAGRADLLLIAVDADRLDGTLRWEPSRDGDLFPHLYGPLPVTDALWTKPLPLGDSGDHILPVEARP
jgi:uncharacterized protein (DUF952 family)